MELTRPFAENGDRQDFPVDTQGDGTMSLQQGFGAFYGLPPEEDGLFIERPKFNQLMYLVSKGVIDNKTAIELLQNNYNSLLTSSAKLLTENLELTVGSGPETSTHFNSLQKALNYSVSLIPKGNIRINITLKSGFVLEEQILMNNADYSFVKIISEDNEVLVNGENFINLFNNVKAVFFLNKCATSPQFSCIFKLSDNGVSVIDYGFVFDNGSIGYMINSGFKNCKVGIYANTGSVVAIKKCDFSNSKEVALQSGINSLIQASSPIIRDCPAGATLIKVINNGYIQIDKGIYMKGSNSVTISNITPNDKSSLDGLIYGAVTKNLDN